MFKTRTAEAKGTAVEDNKYKCKYWGCTIIKISIKKKSEFDAEDTEKILKEEEIQKLDSNGNAQTFLKFSKLLVSIRQPRIFTN